MPCDDPHWPFTRPPAGRPRVLVVAGGLAGLAASHRLLQRGCDVALVEANAFLGGKLGTHDRTQETLRRGGKAAPDTDPHDDRYHMYLNW